MILSIVVPMFNTEAFVRKCLASILGQDVKPDLYEIIVVDDGSSDGSLAIAEEIRKNNFNVTLISQQNLGLGAARNTGLARAKGSYVWFVDSDDYLVEGVLPKIVRQLEADNPGVMTLGLMCADEAGHSIDWINFRLESGGKSSLTGGEFFDCNFRWTYASLYIFRTSLLRDNGIEFQPRINMQDAEMLPRALLHTDHVRVSGLIAYVYVKRSSSFVNSTDPAVREKYFASVIEVRDRLEKFSRTVLNNSAMSSGLRKKLNVIEEILLLSLIYDEMGLVNRESRVEKLVQAEIYPFRFKVSGDRLIRLKRELLRLGVNLSPVFFPIFFCFSRRMFRTVKSASSKCVQRLAAHG